MDRSGGVVFPQLRRYWYQMDAFRKQYKWKAAAGLPSIQYGKKIGRSVRPVNGRWDAAQLSSIMSMSLSSDRRSSWILHGINFLNAAIPFFLARFQQRRQLLLESSALTRYLSVIGEERLLLRAEEIRRSS